MQQARENSYTVVAVTDAAKPAQFSQLNGDSLNKWQCHVHTVIREFAGTKSSSVYLHLIRPPLLYLDVTSPTIYQ